MSYFYLHTYFKISNIPIQDIFTEKIFKSSVAYHLLYTIFSHSYSIRYQSLDIFLVVSSLHTYICILWSKSILCYTNMPAIYKYVSYIIKSTFGQTCHQYWSTLINSFIIPHITISYISPDSKCIDVCEYEIIVWILSYRKGVINVSKIL
jgi:hypothetical protein